MRLRHLSALVALLAASLTARADTLYSLSGTFQSGAMLTGTFELNETTGTADSLDAFYTGESQTLQFTILNFQATGPYEHGLYSYLQNFTEVLDIFLPPLSLWIQWVSAVLKSEWMRARSGCYLC